MVLVDQVQILAGHVAGVAQGVGVVAALLGVAAQVAQHGTRFHRGELILVAQEDHARCGRQSVQQGRHHLQVDHGGFVHDQHVHIERMAGVVAELARVGPGAQQGVQGPSRAHPLREGIQSDPIAEGVLQLPQ